jgi:hypothetical protein
MGKPNGELIRKVKPAIYDWFFMGEGGKTQKSYFMRMYLRDRTACLSDSQT